MNRFKCFEYIRLPLDLGNLQDLNRLSCNGWRVVAILEETHHHVAILERELLEQADIEATRTYHNKFHLKKK